MYAIRSYYVPLARRAQKVFAVEKDRQIIPILNMEILVSGLANISIIEKDILSVDIKALIEDMGGKIVVMGNLPRITSYNVCYTKLLRDSDGRTGAA